MNQLIFKNIDEQLNIIQNGRFATLLFIIGSLLSFVKYDEEEKAIFESISNNQNSNSEANAAIIGEFTSLIFLIAVLIYSNNAINTLRIDENNLTPEPNSSNTADLKGSTFIAFFNLIKVIGFAGSALGYHINAENLY